MSARTSRSRSLCRPFRGWAPFLEHLDPGRRGGLRPLLALGWIMSAFQARLSILSLCTSLLIALNSATVFGKDLGVQGRAITDLDLISKVDSSFIEVQERNGQPEHPPATRWLKSPSHLARDRRGHLSDQ